MALLGGLIKDDPDLDLRMYIISPIFSRTSLRHVRLWHEPSVCRLSAACSSLVCDVVAVAL